MYGELVAVVATIFNLSLSPDNVITPVAVSSALLRKKLRLSIPSSRSALTLVNPLPLPVNVLVPMLMLPKPLVMLPAFNAPDPVKLLYVPLIRAFATVPLDKLVALRVVSPLPLPVAIPPKTIALATLNPPVSLTAPLVVVVASVASVNVLIPAIL